MVGNSIGLFTKFNIKTSVIKLGMILQLKRVCVGDLDLFSRSQRSNYNACNFHFLVNILAYIKDRVMILVKILHHYNFGGW